jgi:hypothetical protein
VHLQRIQVVAHQYALLLAFLVERAFHVDQGIGAACSSAGMTKDV